MVSAARNQKTRLQLPGLRDVLKGVTMQRCKICKSINDVRSDGLCGGCYDNRMARQFGMSYGNYVAKFGNNFLRVPEYPEIVRTCRECGKIIPKYVRSANVFCSKACSEANRIRTRRKNM